MTAYIYKIYDLIISYNIVLTKPKNKCMLSKFKFLHLKFTILAISEDKNSKIQNFSKIIPSCAIFRDELSCNFIIFAKNKEIFYDGSFCFCVVRVVKLEFLFHFFYTQQYFRFIFSSLYLLDASLNQLFLSDLVTTSLF